MSFSLRHVRYFVAVAEAGSISGAARQLSISQSAVTEAVKALEDDLGAALLERSGRGVALTHRGQLFLRHAGRILSAVADARQTRAEEDALTGELHLGASSLVAGYILADLLGRFRRAYPGVTVAAFEDIGEYLEHLLINGELDVAVMVLSRLRESAALEARIIEQSSQRLWLPLGHPLAAREAVSLADVAGERQIVLAVDEIQEFGRGLLARARAAAGGRLPHPLGRGGQEPGRDRGGGRRASRPRLPAVVARRRPHRGPADGRAAAAGAGSASSGAAARASARPAARFLDVVLPEGQRGESTGAGPRLRP